MKKGKPKRETLEQMRRVLARLEQRAGEKIADRLCGLAGKEGVK